MYRRDVLHQLMKESMNQTVNSGVVSWTVYGNIFDLKNPHTRVVNDGVTEEVTTYFPGMPEGVFVAWDEKEYNKEGEGK